MQITVTTSPSATRLYIAARLALLKCQDAETEYLHATITYLDATPAVREHFDLLLYTRHDRQMQRLKNKHCAPGQTPAAIRQRRTRRFWNI